jgi:hypothetical protein
MCDCTYIIKLLWKLQYQCPVCSSSEAIVYWQGWTDKFLHDPIALLFVYCLMMLSIAKVIEHW